MPTTAQAAWPYSCNWVKRKISDGKSGVDFVLFDGEEFVFADRDPYFLGSTHFAEE